MRQKELKRARPLPANEAPNPAPGALANEAPNPDASTDAPPETPVGKTKKRLRWLLWLLLLVPLAYLVVQVAVILTPRLRTAVVLPEVMTDAISVQGYVSMDSVPVYGGGVMYYTVPAGQRVSAGGEVALVYASQAEAETRAALEQVNNELAMLEAAQGTVAEGGNVDVFLRQMENGLMDYLGVLGTGQYGGIGPPGDEMALAANRMQVATGEAVDFSARLNELNAQKAALEAGAVPSGTLSAPQTGYFVPAGKQDRLPKPKEELTAFTAQQLQQAMAEAPTYYDDSVAGHMVTDYQWRFYTTVPLKDADKFPLDGKLEIAFPDVSQNVMPVTVASVQPDEAAGLAKVELNCEYISPEILNLSLTKAEIIFSTEKGLRIEKKSLRVIEGQTCVYVKFGNQVYLRRVQVLVDGDPYFLIPSTNVDGENEVKMYDEVVVESGGIELYDKKIL